MKIFTLTIKTKPHPPRMLIKVDIEKAYDTLNWDVILATLARMNFFFPYLAFLHQSLFQFHIFFALYQWLSYYLVPSFKGSETGRPSFSPFFHLILSYAKQLNLIPGFCHNLRHDFNHLIYAEDLIFITSATKKFDRNVKLCQNIYADLARQKPNQSKSEIYFPSWFNKIISYRIFSIMNFSSIETPFRYLGSLTSQKKKLANMQFIYMIDNINVAVANWDKA